MRRTLPLFLVFMAALVLFSCAGEGDADDGRLRVVTTIFPQYDMVRAAAGDRVSLDMLVSPGSEAHTYEPTAADLAAVADADLFIYAGGDIDPWAEALAEAVGGSGVISFSLTDAVGKEHHEHEHEDGDEHIWTSPENDIVTLRYITDALARLDPDGEETYRRRAEEYAARLSRIGEELSRIAEGARGRTVVIADRFPFDSLFGDYGIAHAEALGGCSVGQEPPVAVVAELIDLVRREKIPFVFHIEFSDKKIADTIAAATGCGERLLHSCHNVSREDFDAGVTLCDLMERNAANLLEVLS